MFVLNNREDNNNTLTPVSDLLDPVTKKWNSSKMHFMFPIHIADRICMIRVFLTKDNKMKPDFLPGCLLHLGNSK